MKNGENGMRAVPRYAPTAVTANNAGASARSRGSRSRPGTSASAAPLAPMPNSAIETTRNAKWYQIDAEKMRMNVTWNSSVAAETRKIPACAENGGDGAGSGTLGRNRVIDRD